MSNAKCPQKIVTPQTYRLIRINKLTRRYTPPNRTVIVTVDESRWQWRRFSRKKSLTRINPHANGLDTEIHQHL